MEANMDKIKIKISCECEMWFNRPFMMHLHD